MATRKTNDRRRDSVLVDVGDDVRVIDADAVNHVFTHFLQLLIVAAAALAVGGFVTLVTFRAAYNSEVARQNEGYRPVRPAASVAATGAESALAGELLLARVKYEALGVLGARDAFAAYDGRRVAFVPEDRNATNRAATVLVYDVSRDAGYSSLGRPQLVGDAAARVAESPLGAQETVHALGFDGSKFVVWRTGNDNSPGPCHSAWLEATGLYSVDIDAAQPTFEAYVAPPGKAAAERATAEQCEAAMKAGR